MGHPICLPFAGWYWPCPLLNSAAVAVAVAVVAAVAAAVVVVVVVGGNAHWVPIDKLVATPQKNSKKDGSEVWP